jgi:NAD+--asparagine ADP-ribosyltransferase
MEINNFSDQDLIDLKNKQDEKLTRYMKCYNEATERTIKIIRNIEAEIIRRKLNKTFNIYSKEFKEDYIRYNNYTD